MGDTEPTKICPPLDVSLIEDGYRSFDFSEQSIRKAFVKKVYAILACQLLVTLSCITFFVYTESVKFWAQRNPWLIYLAIGSVFICIIAMACYDNVRRQAPMNFIFLGIFTIAESFLLGYLSCLMEPEVVMTAVGITAVMCIALTAFAFQTKWDFTFMGGSLICICIGLIIFGILASVFQDRILSALYASIGAILFSLFLVYDTQLMMGGEHKYTVSPEEYIFAALNLYLDIINIFIFVLRLLSGR